MHTDLTDTATPIVVEFRAARAAAGKRAQHPDDGTDVAARIFMACLVLLFLALAALALRSSFAGGPSVPKPHASRTYCSDVRWGMPFPYGKCFIVPDN